MSTTRSKLQSAGVLDTMESVCASFGITLETAMELHRLSKKVPRKEARDAMYSVLFLMGWDDERIAETFDVDTVTIERALDSVLVSSIHQFLPKTG